MLFQFIKKWQSPTNYWPISLLWICGKLFERHLYNEVFDFFITNHLIFRNQSDFKPGESCMNQLLSMAHGIHGLFDKRYEV